MSTVNIHQGYIQRLKSGVGVPLPDWAILFTVKEREDDLQLLSQVGAHEALHLDKEVVTAGLHGGGFLPVSMLHLNDTHRGNTVKSGVEKVTAQTCRCDGDGDGKISSHARFSI